MTDDVFCAQCGHRNLAGSNFCSACGSRLAMPSAGDDLTLTLHPLSPEGAPGRREIVVRVPAAGPAVLILERGEDAGTTFDLVSATTVIGRTPESDVFLDDVTVSRKHASITYTAEGYVLTDAGSLNGTYVNGDRISSAVLHPGDEVLVGKFRLLFEDAGEATRADR